MWFMRKVLRTLKAAWNAGKYVLPSSGRNWQLCRHNTDIWGDKNICKRKYRSRVEISAIFLKTIV